MLRLLQRRITVLSVGLAMATGLPALSSIPAQAATFAVSITASVTTVEIGEKVTFSGVLSPRPSSRTIALQRRYVGASAWTTVRTFTAASTGKYSITTGFGNDRDRYYRVHKPKASNRSAGYSSSVKVVVNPATRSTLASIAPGTVPLSGTQVVTITGTNLAGTTRVTVTAKVPASHTKNGTGVLPELAAGFTVLDSQRLQITPPASVGGSNLVKVYTPSGTVTGTLRYARTSRTASTFEKAILDQVNLRRAKVARCNGRAMPAVSSVAWDGRLSDLALEHARDLATRQSVYKGLNHVTSGLKAFQHRFTAAGFTTGNLGEDLALSPKSYTATQVVAQWMASKTGHCESVMGKNWRHAGVGVAAGEWNGQSSIFTNLDLRS